MNHRQQEQWRQSEWDRFHFDIRQSLDLMFENRILEIRNESVARDIALRASRPAPQVVAVEQSIAKPSTGATARYQLQTQGDTIIKLDTETGQTWQASKATNGVVQWKSIRSEDSSNAPGLTRAQVLHLWKQSVMERDKLTEYEFEIFAKKAAPQIEKREKELARQLNGAEMAIFLDMFYRTEWKSTLTTTFQK